MSKLRVYFIDVGQGDCTLVSLPDKTAIVIDCAKDLALQEILADKGIAHIRALVATHLDKDHIGGLTRLLDGYEKRGTSQALTIDALWVPENDRARSVLTDEAYDLLCFATERAEQLGIHVKNPTRDGGEPPKSIWRSEDGRMCVELLLPFHTQRIKHHLKIGKEGNPVSGVVRVRHGQRAVMIGGDAVLGSYERLCKDNEHELQADVIRSSHHAGDIVALCKKWKSPADLYARTRSQIVVHSVGTVNGYDHPLPEHIRASKNSGNCHVMCTQLTSQCHSNLADARLRAHGSFDVAYPYYHLAGASSKTAEPHNVPCAGTVLVVLDDDLRTFPTVSEHRAFVNTLDHALCR